MEDTDNDIVGFRKPQLGALHAILAHWSNSTDIATVVLPTGLGKTETMLATLIAARCHRVLVVVPTDALRSQISNKFETLGLLGENKGHLIARDTLYPVVGTLTSRPATNDQVDAFFSRCNVLIATSQLLGGCEQSIQNRITEQCSHLFIDEAHHAEAPTWKILRDKFREKLVLQFTATPFRADGQKLEGKFIYVYSLKNAQEEGHFSQIRFHEISEFDPATGDRAIAVAALDELDGDESNKHIVMARVSTIKRATEIFELYQSMDRYEAVAIHSKLNNQQLADAKEKLLSGQVRIVVCVDMLGEGFDMPELKIAAFHDIRKSLAITLQLAGRFTRTRTDLGAPVFIANTALADVREELKSLYSQGPDWNALLPEMATGAIDAEIGAQEFFQGFNAAIPDVPLRSLRPAASMVVYRTYCADWTPLNYEEGFRNIGMRDALYHSLNNVRRTLVVLAATEQRVRWSEAESIRELGWELFVAVWDQERGLLYLHGSNIDGTYRDQAVALCGESAQLLSGSDLFKCFHGINRLVLNNVGLNEHLGRNVRYTGRMGADVEMRIGQVTRRGATKAVIAGTGFENGQRATVGAAKGGRVWSHQRLQVNAFARWAALVGAKLADQNIDPENVLRGTLKPVPVTAVPEKVGIAVDWPHFLLEQPEKSTAFILAERQEQDLATVDIELLPRNVNEPVKIRVYSNEWDVVVRLELFEANEVADFRFVYAEGQFVSVQRGRRTQQIADFFSENPPIIWFADGSSLEGCEYVELPNPTPPFPVERLRRFDWQEVDIRRESQGEQRANNTIQFRVIETLSQDQRYDVIFDDDGSGEAADVVAIAISEENGHGRIDVEFYHCKYSGSDAPGGRITDLYEVCGQAQRSVKWLINRGARSELFNHLLRREAGRITRQRPTRFERGDSESLRNIRERIHRYEFSLRVFVVQPGLSRGAATVDQMTLLAVTERYLKETYEVPFEVICSD
jgi:superfamily II DNA or RNA helicase